VPWTAARWRFRDGNIEGLFNIELQIGVFKSMMARGDVVAKSATRQVCVTLWEGGMINQPTLWPQSLKDEMRMKLALESLEKENRGLKELVVRLSKTVLRNIVDGKPVNLSKKYRRSLKDSPQ
jgi:hypothetical protein